LRAMPSEPDFALKITTDRFALVPGKPLEISVTVERRGGLTDVIEIAAEDLPQGVTAKPVTAEAGGKTVKLQLTGEGGPVSGRFCIVGVVKRKDELTRMAHAPLPDYGISTPELWLTMGPQATAPSEPPPKKKKG